LAKAGGPSFVLDLPADFDTDDTFGNLENPPLGNAQILDLHSYRLGSHVKSFVDRLRRQTQVHEEEPHCVSQIFVAPADSSLVLQFGSGDWLAAGGGHRSNDLVAENYQSNHGAQPFWNRFVSARVAGLLDESLAAEFLDIVGPGVGRIRIPVGRSEHEPRLPVPKR
jgi:hypothetical protein